MGCEFARGGGIALVRGVSGWARVVEDDRFWTSRDEASWPEFSWPIWTGWAGLDVVRSLLGLAEVAELGRRGPRQDITEDEVARRNWEMREKLREMGVDEVFRAARVRIGKGANFKVSFRPAMAV